MQQAHLYGEITQSHVDDEGHRIVDEVRFNEVVLVSVIIPGELLGTVQEITVPASHVRLNVGRKPGAEPGVLLYAQDDLEDGK